MMTRAHNEHDHSRSPQALINFDSGDEDDQLTEDGFVKIDADALPKQDIQVETDEPTSLDNAVIAVMGVTGSGKSSFISLLADEEVEVGHGLESSTVDIGFHSYSYAADKTVFLIDFPGFGDTDRSDAELLKDISCFLATMKTRQCRLIGVLYLHRITDVRIGGSALKNLHLFEQLCGLKAATGIIFVTTMWNELERTGSTVGLGMKRQEQLQQSQFWGTMIAAGSQVDTHDGSLESAQQIVSRLISQNSDIVLNIVHQLVNESKTLDQTDAGKFINQELQRAQEKFEKELIEYQESMAEAIRAHDKETVNSITREKEHAQDVMKRQQLALQSLHLDLKGLNREQKPRFQNLATSLTKGDRLQCGDLTRVPNLKDNSTEKRIENLEKELNEMRQKEMQYQKALTLQQVNQEAQNLAQIQRMRKMADQNRKDMADMNSQLNYERQRSRTETRYASKVAEFFRRLFANEFAEHGQLTTGRSHKHYQRRDDSDMYLAS